MFSILSVFTLLYLILENMSTIVKKIVFLVIFDTCDVMYNWSISPLPFWHGFNTSPEGKRRQKLDRRRSNATKLVQLCLYEKPQIIQVL